MKDHVLINKQHLFHCRQIELCLAHHAVRRPAQGLFPTVRANIHLRTSEDHIQRQQTRRSVEALLEEALGRCPSLVDEPLKGLGGDPRPEVSSDRPLLLKERAKRRLLNPEKSHVPWIVQRMLGASNPLKVLVIEPVHIRMGIPRIARSPIHVTPVHRPDIGHDINVSLRDVRGDIPVDESGNEKGFHCASQSNFTESVNAERVMLLVAERESSWRFRRSPSFGVMVVEQASMSAWTAS